MTEIAKYGEMSTAIEQVVIGGDLSALSPAQRVEYYRKVCESLGLNPFTNPFAYITLNGKLTLYARKDATEQLRKIHGVSIAALDEKVIEGVYVVTATAQAKDGRIDQAKGAVSIDNLKGENKANAIMKAETKAKRRVTLSICGLGWADESEVDSIPGAQAVRVDTETGEIITTAQPRTVTPQAQHRPARTPAPQVLPQPPAPVLSTPTGEEDIDFRQGDQWDNIPSAAESDAQAAATMLDVAQGLLHNPDIRLSDNATRMIAKLRELDKQSGDRGLSTVKKDGTGSGQYGLLVSKIDRCTAKDAHSFVLAALFGYEVSKENPPGWKAKELIDWLEDGTAGREVTAATLKEIWSAIQEASKAHA